MRITGFFPASMINYNLITIPLAPAGPFNYAGVSRVNGSAGFIGNINRVVPPRIILRYAMALCRPIHFIAGRRFGVRRPYQILYGVNTRIPLGTSSRVACLFPVRNNQFLPYRQYT